MVKKNIFSVLLIIVASVFTVSCGKDYLQTTPQSATSPSTIFESTDNAALAINGIAKIMTSWIYSQGFNGEGTIYSWYANFTGNDCQKCGMTGWAPIYNFTYNERDNTPYTTYPWYYYYMIIGNANQVLANIDNAKGTESAKNFIKAQALTFRAYSFFMMSQLYCHRWCDSNNGADQGLILRTDTSTGDLDFSTLAETYEQVYEDLDTAIELYTASGEDRSAYYEPNLDVAYAVYARAALTREDWANAAKYAPLARKNHPLMSSKEYMDSGFSVPNDEWIWGIYDAEDQTLYFSSFYCYQGSNASAGAGRTYPCAISKELYDQIPSTDARRALWIEPTAEELSDAKFNKISGQSTGILYKRVHKDYPVKVYSTATVYQYMQIKFQAQFMPGGGPFNIFRSAEMYLTEAEAYCHIGGKEANVKALLEELNAAHNPGYTCTKSGEDLLNEVKLYRRIDLWGEGFDWFDYKRWKQPIVRKSIADGGSWHTAFAITLNPEDSNDWTWVIPKSEKDYNGAL